MKRIEQGVATATRRVRALPTAAVLALLPAAAALAAAKCEQSIADTDNS